MPVSAKTLNTYVLPKIGHTKHVEMVHLGFNSGQGSARWSKQLATSGVDSLKERAQVDMLSRQLSAMFSGVLFECILII